MKEASPSRKRGTVTGLSYDYGSGFRVPGSMNKTSRSETWNPELGTRNLELGTWNSELGTWNLELGTWN
jgi:hypothetical protein